MPYQGTVSIVDGRFTSASGDYNLVELFMKRAQYSGVSSGSKKLPLESQLDGEMMPGGSGDQFFYRGYALRYAQVADTWDLETSDESALAWTQMTGQPDWMATGTEVQFRFGNDPVMYGAKIERSSGIFGGQGIDEIIYREIGGVQLQVTGGELQN